MVTRSSVSICLRGAGTDLGGIVLADPADIEVFAVVGEIRSRGLAHRLAVVRIELLEDCDYRLRLARRAVEEIGELWSAADTWNLEWRQFNCCAKTGKNGRGQHHRDSKPETAEGGNGNHKARIPILPATCRTAIYLKGIRHQSTKVRCSRLVHPSHCCKKRPA